jgi:hypothetical protein
VSDDGIEIDGTRDLMVAFLVANGVASDETLDALRQHWRKHHEDARSGVDSPFHRRQPELRAQWRKDIALHDLQHRIEWQVASHVAHQHDGHGCPKTIDGVAEPRCPSKPCKIEAVSLALMELTDHYHGEFGANRVYRLLAERLETLARRPRGKRRLFEDIRGLCAELTVSELATQRMVRPELLAPPLSELCTAAINAPTLSSEALLVLAATIHCRVFLSPSHRQVNPGRGRPRQRIRNSLYQHLNDGGFTRKEAEALVVEAGGAYSRSGKARFQNRVRRTDDRGILPWEVHTGERESPVGRGKRTPPKPTLPKAPK